MADGVVGPGSRPIATVARADDQGGAHRFNVGEPPKPQASREAVLALIVKLLSTKEDFRAKAQEKVDNGVSLHVKGIEIESGVLREALAKAIGKRPAALAPQTAPTAAAAKTPTSSAQGARFEVAAPSAAALAQKALQECETAEPFVKKVKHIGDHAIAILPKPNISTIQGENSVILPGEVFDVIARCHRVQDGRTYLRLRRSEGWISTRSAKNFAKIVIKAAENECSVEPDGCQTVSRCLAGTVLSRVNPDGQHIGLDGQIIPAGAAAMKEPRTFRIIGRAQSILSQPSTSAPAAGGTLQANDEFQADAYCAVLAEGRAYLRLRDGRGWVCERLRHDISRYAVEGVDFPTHQEHHDRRMAVARARKLVGLTGSQGLAMERPKSAVIERMDASLDTASITAAAAEAAKPPPRSTPLKDEAVLLRSDTEIWPKLLGDPRPMRGQMRNALRRLARSYHRKVKECEEDLKEVEKRIEAFARACDGKKTLQTHAETLRKEIAKIEQEWKAAIEKDIPGAGSLPLGKPSSSKGRGTVAPVQVLGEAWHCAVIRAEHDDGEGGKSMVQHFGPLRADTAAASEDLQSLSKAMSNKAGCQEPEPEPEEPEEPATKKRRTAKEAQPATKMGQIAMDAD